MNKYIATALSLTALVSTGLMPVVASAQRLDMGGTVNAGVSTKVNVGTSVHADVRAEGKASVEDRAKERGKQEIERRTDALRSLSGRIEQMGRISATTKAELSAQLQAQITALQALKVKIDSETSTTTLKEDLKAITDSYRIYMVIMPKSAILAAVDRINTIAGQMDTLGTKLSARISAAASAGANVSVAQTAMTDYLAKVADAKVQATAAHNLVVNLQPDNGNTTVAASNKAALKDARAKIQAAHQDFVAARKDIETIRKNLPKVEGSATSTVRAETH